MPATLFDRLGLAMCCVVGLLGASRLKAQEPDIVEKIESEADSLSATDSDVTESIVDTASPTPVLAPTPNPSVVPGADPNRFEVSGWARESVEFYPYDAGLRRSDLNDASGVPRDRLLSHTQLFIRSNYQHGDWFQAAVSGTLDIALHVEGSGQDLDFWSFSSQGMTALADPRLHELYLGFFADHLEFKIGQQRVAWGVADILSPNDVVNARDLKDPVYGEPELNHIPTPLARATLDWDVFALELSAAPVFVPDRSALYGSNWSAIQPDAPPAYRGLFSLLGHAADPSVQEQLNGALYQTSLPNRNGRGVSAGAKMSLRFDGLDIDLYYHYGFDGTPYLWLDPAFAQVLQTTDFSRAKFADLAPILRAVDGGLTPLLAEYIRRHHVGFDLVTPVGPLMVRVDAAFQSERVFYTTALTSIASPTLLAVLSLDYQTGSIDKVLVLEGAYIRILDPLRAPLLVYARDSYGVGGVTRWPLFDTIFAIEMRVLAGIEPRFYSVQPSLIAKFDPLQVRVGGLILNGEANSFGWYYRHNASIYLQVRASF